MSFNSEYTIEQFIESCKWSADYNGVTWSSKAEAIARDVYEKARAANKHPMVADVNSEYFPKLTLDPATILFLTGGDWADDDQ